MLKYIENESQLISIHAARVGCDCVDQYICSSLTVFQSTQPKRAATSSYPKSLGFVIFQSTQPKRAATRKRFANCAYRRHFNPRSPRGLRPSAGNGAFASLSDFNPRSPRGLRRILRRKQQNGKSISIHAAQEGCDYAAAALDRDFQFQSTQPKRAATRALLAAICSFRYFNPRSPRGLRLNLFGDNQFTNLFQSTQPKRAATTTS